jgi:hypothetical protein
VGAGHAQCARTERLGGVAKETEEPVAIDVQRIAELSRAAEALIAGPPEYLRAFVGDEAEVRLQRRSVVLASLREQEAEGRVGVSVDDLAADLEAVLRLRGVSQPEDLRAEVVEILRQLEGWQAVDGGLAPERAERDGLRRRVERDYALGRPMRVFLPYWDEVQRALRRRYVSLSANYFAQAIAALDALLDELQYEDPDPLRCHSAWQSLHQALHGINTESRDFARELRALRVDGNHPEVLADIADRLGTLHEKFFRVAAEGAAQVRQRLERLRDERHDGEHVRRLQWALRLREEEWSVGLGESEAERNERLDATAQDVLRELGLFERFMAETGPGSWREGARLISLALVDLTERIHSAIALRLQQTQAIAALLRRARALADGGQRETVSAREWLWNASGAMHAAVWVQEVPSSDAQVRLDRWLAQNGGSPLPLVDEETWRRSLRPRYRPAPPPPPTPLETADDWDPGDDPRMRQQEEARTRLVERLIAAGAATALGTLESFEELRILTSLLWLPRDSAPLRRLGLRIQPPGAGMAGRALLHGPDFDLELDNYRFSATTVAHQNAARAAHAAQQSATPARIGAAEPAARRQPLAAAAAGAHPTHPLDESMGAHPTHPLDESMGAHPTHPLEELPVARPTRPLEEPVAARPGVAAAVPTEPPRSSPRPDQRAQPARRLWRLPVGFGRRSPGGP